MKYRYGLRVDNRGDNLHKTLDKSGNGSSTYDLCWDCAEILLHDPHTLDGILVPYNGEPQGEDGWDGTGAEHPPYAEGDYECYVHKHEYGETVRLVDTFSEEHEE